VPACRKTDGPGSAPLADRLSPLGGSHAQRDLFVRTLALAAREQGDTAALAEILAVRRRLRQDDRFFALLTG